MTRTNKLVPYMVNRIQIAIPIVLLILIIEGTLKTYSWILLFIYSVWKAWQIHIHLKTIGAYEPIITQVKKK